MRLGLRFRFESFSFVWLAFSFSLCGAESSQSAGGNSAYAIGRYRNLFGEAGRSL
jgi:hypothetical protein